MKFPRKLAQEVLEETVGIVKDEAKGRVISKAKEEVKEIKFRPKQEIKLVKPKKL